MFHGLVRDAELGQVMTYHLRLCAHNTRKQHRNKKSPGNAKGNTRQRCVFEGLARTESKLTNPSNDVSFTLARERDRSCAVVLAKNRKFCLHPLI